MTWPASDVVTTNVDAGTDSPATARAQVLDLVQKFNQLRNHVTTFVQGLLASADAAAFRTGIGLGNHQTVTVDGSGNASVAGTLATGGNLSVTGSITATGNVTGYSDERIKEDWQELPEDLVAQLAQVRVGTYQVKGHPGVRFVGVSAQSLREVMPEAVEQDADGLLSVAYGNAGLAAVVIIARELMAQRAAIEQLQAGRP